MNLTPLFSHIRSAIARPFRELHELCDKPITLCPAESYICPPAIYLEGDMDRITALMDDTTHDLEMARIQGGLRPHGATMAFPLTHVELLNGTLYKGPARLKLTREKSRLISQTITETIPNAAQASTFYGSFYFGHWLVDDLSMHLAAEQFGTPIAAARKPYGHEPGYRHIMDLNTHISTRAHFDNFVVFQDFGQNRHKRERYETMRSRLRNAVTSAGNDRVFIRRGASGAARSLQNSPEVEACLASLGFVAVEPESLAVPKITRQISGARLVVSVEGSQMIHGLLNMATGGTLCALQPPDRFNNVFKDQTDCLGMEYAFLTGISVEGGFRIDIEHLQRLIAKIDAHRPA